ncbi:MAG: hypothetical protein WAN46_20930 [Gammaproteobacteria bacterium]|jgi:hypothetical protein
MWSELVEMVERKSREPHPARRPLYGQALVMLSGALYNCHEAFTRYKQEQSDVSFANAVFAVDALISTLQNLNLMLDLFEPELAERLRHYTLDRDRVAYISNPKGLLKTQVETLRAVVGLELHAMQLVPTDMTGFTGARLGLAEYIQETFSPSELFQGRQSAPAAA